MIKNVQWHCHDFMVPIQIILLALQSSPFQIVWNREDKKFNTSLNACMQGFLFNIGFAAGVNRKLIKIHNSESLIPIQLDGKKKLFSMNEDPGCLTWMYFIFQRDLLLLIKQTTGEIGYPIFILFCRPSHRSFRTWSSFYPSFSFKMHKIIFYQQQKSSKQIMSP